MLLVGLTGGIASGKSTVAAMLLERGAQLVDADEIAREVVEPGEDAWHRIVEHFGAEVLGEDRRIDRAKLAAIVFADPEKLQLLNEITHPRVMDVIANRLEQLRDTDAIVVCDIPLIAEAGAGRTMFEILVVVDAPESMRIERLERSRGYTRAQALERIAAQASAEERNKLADVVIDNHGDVRHLEEQVDALWEALQTRARVREDHAP